MLSVTDKKARVTGLLSPEEYEDLLAAFARAGATAAARERGAAVVRRHQQLDHWFRCDCLGEADRAPILVPVKETFIRREAGYPDHADACAFEMDIKDRERHARSLRQQVPAGGFLLARAIARPEALADLDDKVIDGEGDEAPATAGERGAGSGPVRAYSRTRLSQLLFKLLLDAQVHRVGAGRPRSQEQLNAIHRSAQGVSLGHGLALSEVLGTDPGQVAELVDRLDARRSWPRGRRAHGVLVFVAEYLDGDTITTASGARITVHGPISLFGPGKGSRRSGPFVAAVLVASHDGRSPPVPLEAYVHPCWSPADMLPVDSTHERRCLDILVRFQGWMAGKGYAVEMTKPLYDRSGYYLGKEEADVIVKPDFEGIVRSDAGTFVRSFAVELIGYDHCEYKARKKRLKQVILDKRVAYIEHAAHDGAALEENDYKLRRDLAEFGKRSIERFEARPPSSQPTTAAFMPGPSPAQTVPHPTPERATAPLTTPPVSARMVARPNLPPLPATTQLPRPLSSSVPRQAVPIDQPEQGSRAGLLARFLRLFG